MNMHATIDAETDSLASAHEMLVAALEIVDEMQLPAQIGAQLDHAIQSLRKFLGADYAPVTMDLL